MRPHNFNKKMIPYIIIASIFFYILPLFNSSDTYMSILLLVIFPVLTAILGYHYGIKNEFNLILHNIIALLFVPTIFIYYELSVMSFFILYEFILLVSNYIGSYVRKKSINN
ncbi:hypothetical protein [Senegalia massiliensis]|uniref:Exosortase n=1 Tax=Senegalia massiliensis TaxID=1720316 RepID=A0A845QTR1_9CLOT|nr:hypothetical protein [Senegalia massiliensis]NBI06217.1 hypothetical protein [Senegalia massiliensis]